MSIIPNYLDMSAPPMQRWGGGGGEGIGRRMDGPVLSVFVKHRYDMLSFGNVFGQPWVSRSGPWRSVSLTAGHTFSDRHGNSELQCSLASRYCVVLQLGAHTVFTRADTNIAISYCVACRRKAGRPLARVGRRQVLRHCLPLQLIWALFSS